MADSNPAQWDEWTCERIVFFFICMPCFYIVFTPSWMHYVNALYEYDFESLRYPDSCYHDDHPVSLLSCSLSLCLSHSSYSRPQVEIRSHLCSGYWPYLKTMDVQGKISRMTGSFFLQTTIFLWDDFKTAYVNADGLFKMYGLRSDLESANPTYHFLLRRLLSSGVQMLWE